MVRRLDDNVAYEEVDGKHKVVCNHCSHILSEGEQEYLDSLACYEGPVSLAGPQVWTDSSVYVNSNVVFRQYCCPNCFTAFYTEVVPIDKEVKPI